MKFNWGTGILIFLILFLSASAVFIVFASKQQVNLVHKDYYEKGVDYSEQMKVNKRSKTFAHSYTINSANNRFIVELDEYLSEQVDSGSMLMFRPSDKTKDIMAHVQKNATKVEFDKKELIKGRYILKFSWYSNGLRYEVNRPVNIQ